MSEAQKILLANVRKWREDQQRRTQKVEKVEVINFPKFKKLVEYETKDGGPKGWMTVPGGASVNGK